MKGCKLWFGAVFANTTSKSQWLRSYHPASTHAIFRDKQEFEKYYVITLLVTSARFLYSTLVTSSHCPWLITFTNADLWHSLVLTARPQEKSVFKMLKQSGRAVDIFIPIGLAATLFFATFPTAPSHPCRDIWDTCGLPEVPAVGVFGAVAAGLPKSGILSQTLDQSRRLSWQATRIPDPPQAGPAPQPLVQGEEFFMTPGWSQIPRGRPSLSLLDVATKVRLTLGTYAPWGW